MDYPESSYGRCKRCGASWKYAEHHRTAHYDGGGCFALCEACWGGLTPAERLPFYRMMHDEWRSFGELDPVAHSWDAIEAAVLAGK